MDTIELQPFFIEMLYRKRPLIAEVKPCCQQDNIIFFDILINNAYQFTITSNNNNYDEYGWRIALVNADKKVEADLVEAIGQQIEKHLM